MLAVAPLLLVTVAFWMRRASAGDAAAAPADAAVRNLSHVLSEETARLGGLANEALSAPANQSKAFDYLDVLPLDEGLESVVLFDAGAPLAWAGHPRTRVDSISPAVSVTENEFFTILHVAKSRGQRRAIASAVVFAIPPADRLVNSLAGRINGLGSQLELGMPPAVADSATGSVPGVPVLTVGGRPLLFASTVPASAEAIRFEIAARNRARLGVALLLGFALFIVAAWRERRDLTARLFALGTGLLLTAIIPWSEFSNASRAFDPGFYFSRIGGPYTANAAALLTTVVLLLMGAFAINRARPRMRMSALAAGILAVVMLGLGLALASNIVRGAGQPSWGATPGLWLSWELPVFLFLFTVLIGVASLARIALGKSAVLSVRAIIGASLVAGIVATGALWMTTTRQRIRLAERDLAALTRVEESEQVLFGRFLAQLGRSTTPQSDADLLSEYSSSELSAAEFPVMLETRDKNGNFVGRLDLAPAETDSASIAFATRTTSDSAPIITFLGPTGVQVLGRVMHSDGAITTVVALPHTRLVAPPAFASLLGIGRAPGGDPPYTIVLTEASPAAEADIRSVHWHRMGDQWHGDRLIPTSAGMRRAHVEVDLRSLAARGERAVLIVLLDVLLAGLLWLLGAAAEKPFRRWLKARAGRWMRTYRARLTLALFAFFVFPALAFALWSYQRLRSDDRQTRELLVGETLQTVGSGVAAENLADAARRFDAPLFRYAGGFLDAASDSLFAALAPGGIALPPPVHLEILERGELTASAMQSIAGSDALIGYRAILGPNEERYVLAAPARGDDLVIDRRRRDLGILVLFSTAIGAVAALLLSGLAAKRLARDLELSRIEVARAERVIAWGEMARQVAHEIKNPLTPIRLGVQHLRRARSDNRADFDRVLDENVGRILSEIDRLDSIARAFSRYGSAPADLLPAERIDVAAVVRDVVALEQMGKGVVKWKLRGADHQLVAMARADELREVMLNVLENARLAGAGKVDITLREEEKRVTIETRDDGTGIPAAALPRIFEPHFSTRTTGSGLGLAASRRIIEQWGGEIAITSEVGTGARVLVALVRPAG
jgi:signal transduction histidine kinase